MQKAPAALVVTGADAPDMNTGYDDPSTGSPLDQWRRVFQVACPVSQLRLNDLQFIGIKIAGKLEVVHVALVINLIARRGTYPRLQASGGPCDGLL